jgi:hypothetical protein
MVSPRPRDSKTARHRGVLPRVSGASTLAPARSRIRITSARGLRGATESVLLGLVERPGRLPTGDPQRLRRHLRVHGSAAPRGLLGPCAQVCRTLLHARLADQIEATADVASTHRFTICGRSVR